MLPLHELNPVTAAFLDDAIALIKTHGGHLDPKDMLALASHLVGQLIAQQDKNVPAAIVLRIIMANIDQGHGEAAAGLAALAAQP